SNSTNGPAGCCRQKSRMQPFGRSEHGWGLPNGLDAWHDVGVGPLEAVLMHLRSSRAVNRCLTGLLPAILLLLARLVARLTPLKPRLTIGTGHLGGVTAFSPDGDILACVHATPGSNEDTIRLWDIEKGIEILTLGPVEYFIDKLEFTRDGKRLVASGRCSF